MMTMPTSATPKHMPTPINRTTSTARIASSRAAILIKLMAPNDKPNNTAVPGFFMVHQDYHTVRCPPCESARFIVGPGKLRDGEKTIARPVVVIGAPAGVFKSGWLSLLSPLGRDLPTLTSSNACPSADQGEEKPTFCPVGGNW